MPLSLNSYLKFILEILRSSTSSFKSTGCWESKIVYFSHFNGCFNNFFVQCVPDFSGDTMTLSKKVVSDGSMFQVGALKISLSCHLPLETVVSQLHLYFCLWNESLLHSRTGTFACVSYLHKAGLTNITLANPPGISQQPPEPASCTKLTSDSEPPYALSRRWLAGLKGRGTWSWGLFSLIWGDGS